MPRSGHQLPDADDDDDDEFYLTASMILIDSCTFLLLCCFDVGPINVDLRDVNVTWLQFYTSFPHKLMKFTAK